MNFLNEEWHTNNLEIHFSLSRQNPWLFVWFQYTLCQMCLTVDHVPHTLTASYIRGKAFVYLYDLQNVGPLVIRPEKKKQQLKKRALKDLVYSMFELGQLGGGASSHKLYGPLTNTKSRRRPHEKLLIGNQHWGGVTWKLKREEWSIFRGTWQEKNGESIAFIPSAKSYFKSEIAV